MKTKEEIIELLRTDVQAFNAYRRQLIEQEIYDLDLSFTNLSGANLRNANLNCANLYYASLSGSNLSGADLGNATLWNADLRNSNLSRVNLSFVDLSCVKLDQEFIQVTGLGSKKRMTTYLFSDDLIFCGCFKGSLKEFKKRVKKTYPEEENKYRLEYLDFIKMINKKRKRLKNDLQKM